MYLLRITALLFLILGLRVTGAQAQKLIISMKDGTQQEETFLSLQKLTFEEHFLQVVFREGNPGEYDLVAVRKIYFNPYAFIGESPAQDANSLRIYPNPAAKEISVSGILPGSGPIVIYHLTGSAAITCEATTNPQIINIQQLKPGLYLLKSSGRITKFVRQ